MSGELTSIPAKKNQKFLMISWGTERSSSIRGNSLNTRKLSEDP